MSTSIGVETRTGVRVSEFIPTPRRGLFGVRVLQVGVPVEFIVNVTSEMTPLEVIVKLQRSMDRGDFLDVLATDLGRPITNTTKAVFIDVTNGLPTPSPSGTIEPQGDYTILFFFLFFPSFLPPFLPPFSFTVTSLLTFLWFNSIYQ
jgi:hypothetical protein